MNADTPVGTRMPVMPSNYVFGRGRVAPPGAGSVGAPAPAALTPTPAAPVGLESALPTVTGVKEQMVASALADRPTYAQLAQLVQQYLPAAKAALMPTGTSSGLYG